MPINKYVKDYKLENVTNKKGRVVTKAVYVGNYYGFRQKGEALKKAKTSLTAATAAGIVFFVTGISFYRNTGFSAQYYTLIPFAACFLPLLYLAIAAYYILRTKDDGRVTNERKDKMRDRVAKSGLGILILDGLAAAGIAVAGILKAAGTETRNFTVNDLVFILSALGLLAAAGFAFSTREKFVMDTVAGPDGAQDK